MRNSQHASRIFTCYRGTRNVQDIYTFVLDSLKYFRSNVNEKYSSLLSNYRKCKYNSKSALLSKNAVTAFPEFIV